MAAEDEDVFWLHSQRQVSIVELAQSSGLTETTVRELVEYGALAPADPQAREWSFSADCVVRVRSAARLCTDLELETHALALVLSFLERINRLEGELRHLQAQLAAPRR
jgi:chaperone modulatory protein CbpM